MYVFNNRKIRILSSTALLALLISWCLLVTISRQQQHYSCHAFSINNGSQRTKATTATTTVLTPQRQQRYGRSQFHAATNTPIPSTLLLLKSRITTALQAMNDPDSNDESEDKPPAKVENLENKPKKEQSLLDKLKWGIFLTWSYTFTAFAIIPAAGLVLNLFGYGYTFSKEDGFHIDTLQNLRTEIQFRKVDKIYQQQYNLKEQKSESQPPSILPR